MPPSKNNNNYNSKFELKLRHKNPSSQGKSISLRDNENLVAQRLKSLTEHKKRLSRGIRGTNRGNVIIREMQSLIDKLDKAAKYLPKFLVFGRESDKNRVKLLFLLYILLFGYKAVS